MEEKECRELAAALVGPVLAAGFAEMRHYDAGVTVETKADATPVTAADREAEAIILEVLRRIAPGIPVVAEEETAAGRTPEIGSRFFLVDPLDGTKEFIAHRGEFTINIALVENHYPVFGMIYAPAIAALYATLGPRYAAEARIFPHESGQPLSDVAWKRIQTRAPDWDALAVIASRSHMNVATQSYLARYRIATRLSAGSSLKFCLIAKGEADIYPRLGPTSEWDTAAGQAVLTAAGGSVTTLDGEPFTYGKVSARFRNPAFVAWGRGPLPPAMPTS
jgi:3'(2'), 5'-bisphosphate nucleotidase